MPEASAFLLSAVFAGFLSDQQQSQYCCGNTEQTGCPQTYRQPGKISLGFSFNPGDTAIQAGVENGSIFLFLTGIPAMGLAFCDFSAVTELPVVFCILQPVSLAFVDMLRYRSQFKAAGQAKLRRIFCGFITGNMLFRNTFFPADGAYIPVTGFIAEPGATVNVGGGSRITTDIAVRVTAVIIGMRCKGIDLIAATAGIPMSGFIIRPLAGILMLMPQLSSQHIAAGETVLRLFLSGGRSGVMTAEIFLTATGGAGMPVSLTVF